MVKCVSTNGKDLARPDSQGVNVEEVVCWLTSFSNREKAGECIAIIVNAIQILKEAVKLRAHEGPGAICLKTFHSIPISLPVQMINCCH